MEKFYANKVSGDVQSLSDWESDMRHLEQELDMDDLIEVDIEDEISNHPKWDRYEETTEQAEFTSRCLGPHEKGWCELVGYGTYLGMKVKAYYMITKEESEEDLDSVDWEKALIRNGHLELTDEDDE